MALSNQDLVAWLLLGDKGYYVDIGAGNGQGEPCASNTYWLEEKGWTGLLLDINHTLIEEARTRFRPKSICVEADITQISQYELYKKHNVPQVIDYLSIDVDSVSLQALQGFPFSDYDFRFLTFEHDLYNPWGHLQKQPSKQFLEAKGYRLFAEDVPLVFASQNHLEDWWLNPKYESSFQLLIQDLSFYRQNPHDIVVDLFARFYSLR